jgi:hypothetical protein
MATETFTLTLDNTPTESVSVTINDTSLTQAGEELFTESGTFTVPAGVTSVNIYAVGAGGGSDAGQYTTGSSGGGGGGAYVEVIGWPVTPGDEITVNVSSGGAGGVNSANSPFEIVTTNSGTGLTKYPQSGTITAGGNAGATRVIHDGVTVLTALGGSRGQIVTGGAGGSGSVHSTVSSLADSHDIIDGNAGENGGSGNGARFPGGGGGAGNAGRGGTGRGDFYRSNGGYNYHKAANGGQGGGMHLYGGVTANPGSNGNDAPALYNGSINYNGAQDGRAGGVQTGNAYGGGAGGGVGGRIRNQTIISGSTRYYYRWFLGKDSDGGESGAVRFAWGS